MAADQVTKMNLTWGELMRAGNAKGLSELYTEDCRVLPPGSPTINGREAVQKLFQSDIDGGIRDAKLTSDEVDPTADSVPDGGTFWERGNYVFYKEGGEVAETGKFVVIWKKTSGNILMFIDIFNSN